jgi:hypothetical protein
LYFLSELEAVQGVSGVTEAQFEKTDKVALIESLWKNQSSNPRALTLIAKMCLHFDVKTLAIWSNILSKMIHLKMVPF